MGKLLLRPLGFLIIALFLGACGTTVESGTSLKAAAESSYCSTTKSTTNPITITANASYYYRQLSTSSGLVGNPVSRGIAYAEVVVKDSSGNTIQCAQTDLSGNISFQIDKTAGTYQIQVNSRAYNSYLKASVLTDPTSNAFYTISKSFTLTGSESSSVNAGSLYAYARIAESPNMEGGAFNILYDIYLANQYIRTQTSTPSFVADKVSVYWKQGFNPGSYVGVSSGLSFYMQGQRELYILGGVNGNTKTADTDHFDNSVIIHEYGHFLEDVYGKSSSPGGSHDGNFIIDPRLAWSEGWANFIQGAVISDSDATRGKYYTDTYGYSGDTTESGESGGIAIQFDLTEPGATASLDKVGTAGEGTFREVSVSRTLYKTITTASIPFANIWTAFSSTTAGMRAPANVYSNPGIFNMFLNSGLTSGQQSSFSSVLNDEKQNKTTVDYADPVTSSSTCGKYPRQLTPVSDAYYGSEPRSNQLRSNDFYLFYYDGSGGTLALNYSQVTGNTIDLDLYLYNSTYTYQEEYYDSIGQSNNTVVRRSARLNPTFETGSESFDLSGLGAGYYLINVKAHTFNKTSASLNGTAQYSLTLKGSYLCPTN